MKKKNITVLAGSRIECADFARGQGAKLRGGLRSLETADTVYRFYVEQSGADGIGADELLKIGTYEKRFSPDFVRLAEIGCEIHRAAA